MPTEKTAPLQFKLLVVDDDTFLRTILVEFLSEIQTYRVDSAFDGQDALEKHQDGRYDLMIVDLKMPRLDGTALIRSIRKRDSRTRIIVLTGHGKPAEKSDPFADCDLSAFLRKPLDHPDDLLVAVKAALAQLP